MIDSREFFLRHSGLKPIGYRPIGEGMCACQTAKRITLYRKSGAAQCAACCCLRQNYTVKDKKSLRLGLGSYLFVSPEKLRFWGNHSMEQHNPAIVCEFASGRMSTILRRLILSPPEPPWMFVSFSASTSADSLAVTTDLAALRFSGETIIGRTPVREVNRTQVLRMRDAGLTSEQWDQYLDAYYHGSAADIQTMRELEKSHPILADIRALPPKAATEHVILRWLLKGKEGHVV
jgi:hypothetical protein